MKVSLMRDFPLFLHAHHRFLWDLLSFGAHLRVIGEICGCGRNERRWDPILPEDGNALHLDNNGLSVGCSCAYSVSALLLWSLDTSEELICRSRKIFPSGWKGRLGIGIEEACLLLLLGGNSCTTILISTMAGGWQSFWNVQ